MLFNCGAKNATTYVTVNQMTMSTAVMRKFLLQYWRIFSVTCTMRLPLLKVMWRPASDLPASHTIPGGPGCWPPDDLPVQARRGFQHVLRNGAMFPAPYGSVTANSAAARSPRRMHQS
jgi:hypothetical protein